MFTGVIRIAATWACLFLAGCASSQARGGSCAARSEEARIVSWDSNAEYSEDAQRHKVEGRVKVAIPVSETGAAGTPRLVHGLGHGLDEAVLQSVRQIKFSPAIRCGTAVPSEIIISMRFEPVDQAPSPPG